MSIFKESFRGYVKKQLELRQAIIQNGNDGEARFESRQLTFSTAAGGQKINIPYGAFFANTLNRNCVIRMSSGADLTQTGVYSVLDQYERNLGVAPGSDLAKMYILEGGVLDVGSKHSDWNTLDANNNATMDWLTGAQPKSGWTNSVNKKNSTYGDSITRGNSINKSGDDYGIVPMPGIIDATIKTKSAYGSIREAKINFKCHNQRQLEILELLYMRPGVPVLLEWGWTTYVDNKGKLITNQPLPTLPEFWTKAEGNMPAIYRKIIDNKEKTGGNYDGLMGMVKNFSFKARKDGGYDCSTELTAMGEIIESLKGRTTDSIGGETYIESILAPFTVASTGGGPNKDAEVEALGKLYDKFKPDEGDLDALQMILIDIETYLLMNDEVRGYTWKAFGRGTLQGQVSLNEAQQIKELWKSSNANNKEFAEDYYDCLDRVLKYFDLQNEPPGYQDKFLTKYILHHGNRGQESHWKAENIVKRTLNHQEKDDSFYWAGSGWKTGFITWEGLSYLINKYSITPLAKDTSDNNKNTIEDQINNEPIIKIATHYISDEDKNPGGTLGFDASNPARLRPYQYARVPMENYEHYDPKADMQNAGYRGSLTGYTVPLLTPAQLCDRSSDHSVCVMPHNITNLGKMDHGNSSGTGMLYYYRQHLMYLSSPKDPKRDKIKQFILHSDTNVPVPHTPQEENERAICNIGLNIDYLIRKYQDSAYDEEDKTYIRKDDFSIYTFIEDIWSDVNRATGGAHKFMPQVDHEKTDLIRIVDMQTSNSDLPDPNMIHTLNIQGNNTVVRDFTYNSLIPSALSATIGIAMQNPDSIGDLDGATFAAMAKNIKNRFIEEKEFKETPPTAEQKKKWKEALEKRQKNITKTAKKLVRITKMMWLGYGQSKAGNNELHKGRNKVDADERRDTSGAVAKQKSLYKQVLRVMGYHTEDGTYGSDAGSLSGKKYYKGQPIAKAKMPNASSVIPLKFNAKMDGIGGIVIGNVFQIDPTRLPRGYKESDIAFVTTGESQKITSGQDWTTTINGQLTLLPFPVAASGASIGGITAPNTYSNNTGNNSTTPSTPAAGMTKLSELKDTSIAAGGTGPLQPIKDLLSDLEGTDGPNPYGVYNYGTSSTGVHPCSHVKGAKANKDALGGPPINTMTMEEIMRRQALPGRVAKSDGCARNTGTYSDGKDINGCEIFAAGKWQIIPRTMKSAFQRGIFQKTDIFDAATQEKLGDYLLLTKRSRLAAYLNGDNAGSEQDLINAVNEAGWEWASAPIVNFAATRYATACGETMSSVMGDVATGAGNHGNYCDSVNKATKKTFVKNVVINLIHSRFQQAQTAKVPSFKPDFMVFDLTNSDTLSGTKQVGKS